MKLQRTLVPAIALAAVLGVGAGPALAEETTATTIVEPATTTTALAANTGDTERECLARPWPATAQGEPTTLKAGSRTYGFLWHDRQGWHLRVTHPGARKFVFTGHVRADEAVAVRKVLDERRDLARPDADGNGFTFRFTNYGRLDGVDFRTDCAHRLAVSLETGGEKVSVRRIAVGRRATHPTGNPVVVTR